MADKAERVVGKAVSGWVIGLTVIGSLGWLVLLVAAVAIALWRPAFWVPAVLWAALLVPNVVLVRHELTSWRPGSSTRDRSALPVILAAVVVGGSAVVAGMVTEADSGGPFRLVVVAWATAAFFGELLFLKSFPSG